MILQQIARAILEHKAAHPGQPVELRATQFVLDQCAAAHALLSSTYFDDEPLDPFFGAKVTAVRASEGLTWTISK